MDLKVVELTNSNGTIVKILNYGARVMSIETPDRYGVLGHITLGYDTAEGYLTGNSYFGATIGRCANRITNGVFSIKGKPYDLNKNSGKDHLHGGPKGFHKVLWDISAAQKNNEVQSVDLHYTSADMEEYYPGELEVKLKYSLTSENELVIEYFAKTDKTTIVNLSHHSFFNLKDGGKSSIDSHFLRLNAKKYTPVSKKLIPNGEIHLVKNSPMDFTSFTKIGDRINERHEQLIIGKGYDHNWVLDKLNDVLAIAAEVYEEESGRAMEVYTTCPGIQLYTGNYLDGLDVGISEIPYQYRSAFCLETQHFPDSPNHDNFPSILLKPEQQYYQKTIYKFKLI